MWEIPGEKRQHLKERGTRTSAVIDFGSSARSASFRPRLSLSPPLENPQAVNSFYEKPGWWCSSSLSACSESGVASRRKEALLARSGFRSPRTSFRLRLWCWRFGSPHLVEAFENGVSRTLGEAKRNLIRVLPSYTFVTEDYETRQH